MLKRLKPQKPTPDFPLFAHANGSWAKKIKGKIHYFGRWEDPEGALREFNRRSKEGFDSKPGRTQRRPEKPRKPYKTFPLTAHNNGQWCKSIGGVVKYFGVWSDPDGALFEYNQYRLAEASGDESKPDPVYTVGELCSDFLDDCVSKVEKGTLTAEKHGAYKGDCEEHIIPCLGRHTGVMDLEPEDFKRLRDKMSKGKDGRDVAPATLKGYIVRVRVCFNWGLKNRPRKMSYVHYGQMFSPPSERAMRLSLAEKDRMVTAEEIRKILEYSPLRIRAMVLLGINCGFGNMDVSWITEGHIDLESGWHTYPRKKTGVARKAPLWPETVSALKLCLLNEISEHEWYSTTEARRLMGVKSYEAVYKLAKANPQLSRRVGGRVSISGELVIEWLRKNVRPDLESGFKCEHNGAPKDIVFRTASGRPFVYYRKDEDGKINRQDSVRLAFGRVLKSAGIDRSGLSFYALRHTFQTIGDESRNAIATKYMMGHAPNKSDMSAIYREEISEPRLKQTTDYIRSWLFD